MLFTRIGYNYRGAKVEVMKESAREGVRGKR
jgi:hypothetical protein